MAKPIKETPILRGEDAERFVTERDSHKNYEALQEERGRILRNYNLLKEAETPYRHRAPEHN